MSGDVCYFNNIETRAVIRFFFLQGKVPKEIHTILIETLGEHAPSYATVKNWVARFNPLNAELNPICKSQLAELFCGVFKFCT